MSLLTAEGRANDEIAAALSIGRDVVSLWRKRLFQQRMAGLEERPRPGKRTGEPRWRSAAWSALREEVRDVWLTRWLRDFVYDLRFSARSFRRSPSFTATIVLSLALGIGATTAIYSLVDQVILRALPVREPARLVLIDWKGDPVANGFGSWNLMSYPICRDLQLHAEVFEGVLCRAATTVTLSIGGEHKPLAAEIVSGTYFPVLGVGSALGRVLGPGDDQPPDASPVVVLAYDFWRTQLAGAPDVVGRKVLVNQYPMTVVGVAAPIFRGIDVGEVPALWIPASMSAQAIPGFEGLLDRRTRWMQVLARLRAGVTPAKAQARLQPWFKSMLTTTRAGQDSPGSRPSAGSDFWPRRSPSRPRARAIPACGVNCRSHSGSCSRPPRCC
jgi:hypothetical protein